MKKDKELFRSWTIIDLDNFRYNVEQLKSHMASDTLYMQIVKADAYGHGSIEIAREAEKLGVHWLGVANSDEGVLLRLENINSRILVLSPSFESEIETLVTYDLTPSISDIDFAQALNVYAKKHNKKLPIHILFDTGMGRAGFLWEEAKTIASVLKGLKNLQIDGLSSHFSMSETEDISFTETQNKRFKTIIEIFKNIGIDPLYKHIANSAAIINCPQSCHTMVRAGLLSYGIYTADNLKNKIKLKPVMTFKSKIGLIKEFPENVGISYNQTFITKNITKAAILPIGYGDGYNFLLSNCGKVLIHDTICPILGRVTMDMIIVDISHVKNAKVGDEVTLIGSEKTHSISIEELSSFYNGLTYEMACNLGRRAQRIYIREHKDTAIEPISRRTFIAKDFTDTTLEKVIQTSLNQRLNSSEIGSIVYQEVLKKLFYRADREISWKRDFVHEIVLSETDLDPLVSKFFYHTKTKLRYKKRLTNDTFKIVCATSPEDLEQYILSPDVEYRWLLDSKIDLVNSFQIDKIMIDDLVLHHSIIQHSTPENEFSNLEIECSHPKLSELLGKEVQFTIDTITYYPKNKHQLTIYIAELTKGITMTFDFAHTNIESVEIIPIFSGKEKYPHEKIKDKKIVMKSSSDEWFFPNSGVVFVW
ncbi:MAG: alanine racemase [Candidatus Celaenobacter antarcticus]|nr:alanine racemase [Candidatus Celaenobacter antarcticus]